MYKLDWPIGGDYKTNLPYMRVYIQKQEQNKDVNQVYNINLGSFILIAQIKTWPTLLLKGW